MSKQPSEEIGEDTHDMELYRAYCAETKKKFIDTICPRLTDHFSVDPNGTMLGAVTISAPDQMIFIVYFEGLTVSVERYRTSETFVRGSNINEIVDKMVKHLEYRIDELLDMEDAPQGKPFLVVTHRSRRSAKEDTDPELLYRIGYYLPNVKLIGDTFEFDRAPIGWLPLQGIKYDAI